MKDKRHLMLHLGIRNWLWIASYCVIHTHWCCERPSICAPLGPCNTWPGKGGAREYRGIRERVMSGPGDAGKGLTDCRASIWTLSQVSLSHRASSDKDKPSRGCQSPCVYFCLYMCVLCSYWHLHTSLSVDVCVRCRWKTLECLCLLYKVLVW